MSDLYSELLVKRKTSTANNLIKYGLIALTVFAVMLAIFMGPIFFIVAVVLGVVDYFFIPRLDVEFEYLHVNDELDVDKIFSRQKRKKAMSIDLKQAEMLAPLGSHRLDAYRNAKTIDFSANDRAKKPYVLITSNGKEQSRILLQLDADMFHNIKRRLPRITFDD